MTGLYRHHPQLRADTEWTTGLCKKSKTWRDYCRTWLYAG